MSELSEAINEMRNMRESYDQIGAAAEAYNTGKTELAANITAKGVQASATETLPELAEKVAAITQETYEINGGEMYAKQLFGSLETPNYWNLYEVLAQLLSDGLLVSYGGILLAEYYRGYDSLALAGAGAGGAYVVSDLDENGQFKMYTNDTTHVWATEFDGKGNRWVAYCFAEEYHDFQITDTNTSPRSIFIGRKVGTINCLVATRIANIVVPDGNELRGLTGNTTRNWDKKIVLKNIGTDGVVLGNISPDAVYVETKGVKSSILSTNSDANKNITIIVGIKEDLTTIFHLIRLSEFNFIGATKTPCVIIKGASISRGGNNSVILGGNSDTILLDFDNITFNKGSFDDGILLYHKTKKLLISAESVSASIGYGGSVETMELQYKSNNKERGFAFNDNFAPNDLQLQNGWCKPLNIRYFNSLTKENVQAHIFDRLGVNDLSTGAVTITLANAVLNLFTQEEIDAVVARTNITIVGA